MAEHRTTAMCHVGMNRDAVREAVKNKLIIGQQYMMEVNRDIENDKKKKPQIRCELVSFSQNTAVFKHVGKNMTETLTYQDIWRMLVEGSFR